MSQTVAELCVAQNISFEQLVERSQVEEQRESNLVATVDA